MKLEIEPYLNQLTRWPHSGRHILAQYDDESIVVYQGYRPSIGHFAARYGYFGGDFSFNRMSWIKPNFLWMMYRSAWGTKTGQEITLAVRLRRSAFDQILAEAVHSTYVSGMYENELVWKQLVLQSSVRLQWDPDHHPSGAKVDRRAIQLGLRGNVLAQYARDWILEIEDISAFVRQQYVYVHTKDYMQLHTPKEVVYPVKDTPIAMRLGLSTYP